MGYTEVAKLLGGVALFLFGMNLMGDGLKNVAGSRLEIILYRLTGTPLKGILLGTGVTAVIQSSSATSVMVVGFVNSGMMNVRQAIGIIMGAIIGTSLTGWVICLSSLNGSGIFKVLSTTTLTTLLAVAGILLLMLSSEQKKHHLARVFLGFAVLMYGIEAMTGAVYPLRESETFVRMLTGFSSPLAGVFIGMLFTAVIQSASAAVGILQALAVTGAVTFQLALPVIMGIAIGASVPVLLSALGANANGRRTALIYLMVDTLGALLFGALFYGLNVFLGFSFMDDPMTMLSVALLNSIFRVIIVLLLSPFIGTMERLVTRLVPDKKENAPALRDVDRLEERFLAHPTLAIEQTRITMNTMAEIAEDNLTVALDLFGSFDENGFARALELEGIVDRYEDKLGNYVVKIMRSELTGEQNRAVSLFLHSVNDYERISDHARNLAEAAKEIFDKGIRFSADAEGEMRNLVSAVREIVGITVKAFSEDDIEAAYRITPLEEIIDTLCDECKLRHIERVQKDECRYEHGFVFNDFLTDMERIGDHCSNIGIALRMHHDELSERHGAVSRLEIEKQHEFDRYYQEYIQKYAPDA